MIVPLLTHRAATGSLRIFAGIDQDALAVWKLDERGERLTDIVEAHVKRLAAGERSDGCSSWRGRRLCGRRDWGLRLSQSARDGGERDKPIEPAELHATERIMRAGSAVLCKNVRAGGSAPGQLLDLVMTTTLLRLSPLLIGLVLVACSGDAPEPPPLAKTAEPIAGGVEDSDAKAHPAVVLIANGNGLCTGSLIAPKLVLTARHCVSQNLQEGIGCDIYGSSTNGEHFGPDYAASSFEIYTGVTPNWGSPVAKGAQLFHPPGTNACNNDIALIVLSTAITTATPLAVRLDWGPQIGELTTAVGYGAINDAQVGSGKRRRRENVPVLTAGQDWNHLTGAGELAVGQAACAGDSGGPVISPAGGVIGIASRVANCSDPNTSAKYVRLDYHKSLIMQAFAAAGASPKLEPGSAPPPIIKQELAGPCQTGVQCLSALCQTDGGYCTDFCGQMPCSSSSTYCADTKINVSGQVIDEKLCVPLPQGTPCEQCRATDCVNLVASCLNNAACKQLLACADACTDAACHDACVEANPAGAEEYGFLKDCACNSSCQSVCSHQCLPSGTGGAAGTGGAGATGGTAGVSGSGGSAGSTAGSAGTGGQVAAGKSGRQGCGVSTGASATPSSFWVLVALAWLRRRRGRGRLA